MAFQSLRKSLIAKTPRVTSCAGAAGVGSVFGMVGVYRAHEPGLKRPQEPLFMGINGVAHKSYCATFSA
jgi:hypothetical protein